MLTAGRSLDGVRVPAVEDDRPVASCLGRLGTTAPRPVLTTPETEARLTGEERDGRPGLAILGETRPDGDAQATAAAPQKTAVSIVFATGLGATTPPPCLVGMARWERPFGAKALARRVATLFGSSPR